MVPNTDLLSQPRRPASLHCGVHGFLNFTFTFSWERNIFLLWHWPRNMI